MMSRKWLLVAPVVSFVASGVMAATKVEKSQCELKKEWYDAHAASLPTNLAEYQALPVMYRSIAYSHLATATRVGLWRAHLESYLKPEAGLTEAQAAFVRGVVARLPLYMDGSSSSGAFQGEAKAREARQLFGDAQAALIFSQVAPATHEEVAASMIDLCDCSYHTTCDDPYRCDFSNCNDDPNNCSTRGDAGCTGKCR